MTAAVEHHHHHTMAPSGQGTVTLNIGAGVGALIIFTPPSCLGMEIEVSPVDDPGTRAHAAVRARYVSGGVCWSEVIDSLPEGEYVVWRDADTPLDTVSISGGSVTEFDWPTGPDDRSGTPG
jgi:hypothetical protein